MPSTVVLLTAALACARTAASREPAPLVIEHVTVIDATGAPPRRDMSVTVASGYIVSVSRSGTVPPPAGARRLDGRGQFLIPGLWDMHAHPFAVDFPRIFSPLAIANGVTGVRDMGFFVDTALHWRGEVRAGRVLGPRLVISARVDGPVNKTPWVTRVAAAAEAVRVVDSLSARGVDFIKVYSWIGREAYLALAAEAVRRRVVFAGHAPYSVGVAGASNAGQRSIEHEDDIMRGCSSREDFLRDEQMRRSASPAPDSELVLVRREAMAMRATYDAVRCGALMDLLARNHTWVTPTLVVYQPYAHAFDSASTQPALLRYVPAPLRHDWRRRTEHVEAADTSIVAAYFSLARTREMHERGVKLLAGTDTPLPFVYPGFSLHDELALLVGAGLSPMEALQSATREPAAYLGEASSSGTIEAGKVADLVLLDADPLVDIRNTRRVRAVVVRGRLVDAAAREALLRDAERAAGRASH